MPLVEQTIYVDGSLPPIHYVERVSSDDAPYTLGRIIAWDHELDPMYHHRTDGQWPAVINLPHETVEWRGMAVPAFDLNLIDPERAAWNRQRAQRKG